MALDTAAERYSVINISSPWRGLNYFPTGTINAQERLAIAFLYSGIAAEAPVEVPDVVGETQAAGTTELEAAGFVVSVQTAYSPSVAVGLVISQDPVGGSFASPGSTVTITVSLGPEPVVTQGVGGKAKKKRKRYLIEIDGQDFEVDSYAEAEKLLQRAKSLAQASVEQIADRAVKKAKRRKRAVSVERPVISTDSPELEELVTSYRADIEAIYAQIARDAEIRELLRLKMIEEDEEDAVIVILLH